jgi:L-threonylcarbamoyladenylate synthase
VSLTAEDALRLQECLEGDGVAILPTDTVYGLACSPTSERAIGRLYELKGRPPMKPSAVMFFSLRSALATLPELGPRTRAALEMLLPGQVTLLLANPERRYPLACDPRSDGSGVLGLRVPALDGSTAALAAIDAPVMQSSANLSGGADPRRVEDVPTALREGADLVLDGGELPGTASTVIDISDYESSGEWRIVREGPLDRRAIEQRLLLAS